MTPGLDPTLNVQRIAGIPVAVFSPERAAMWIVENAALDRTEGLAIHLVNAYTIVEGERAKALGQLLRDSRCNLPDSRPLSWLVRNPAFEQVRGPDLFRAVLRNGTQSGLKHYLIGGTETTLESLNSAIQTDFPAAKIVGSESPPFRESSIAELADRDDRVRASGADVVWIGLGTPKQDYEVERLAASLPVVTVAVGAAFDFVAGTRREAPRWMTTSGTEWLYRFATEPKRLWKRYLLGNVVFIWTLLRRRGQ